MFRLTRPMKGIFSTSRLPIRIAAKQQQGKVENVRKVKIRQKGVTVKTVAMTGIALYIASDIYARLVLDPLEKGAAEALEGMPVEQEEQEEGAIFIPFPGTVQQLKPRPYRGQDPEWQEFVKFSQDKELQTQLRDELAQYVRKLAQNHPVIFMKVGKELKQRRCWLDVDFPPAGPPEFVRSGIEISDEKIGWATNPVDSHTVYRIRSVLWPSAMAVAFWNFAKVLAIDDTKRFASYLGIKSKDPPLSIDQILSKQQQMMKGTLPNNKPGLPTSASNEAQAANNPKAMIKISDPAKATLSTQTPGEEKTSEAEEVGPGTKTAAFWHMHFNRPITVMKTKIAQLWRPAPSYPPRGSILFSGMVELEAPKAFLVFDIRAAWDPQTKDFDTRSMRIQLRRLQWRAQAPIA